MILPLGIPAPAPAADWAPPLHWLEVYGLLKAAGQPEAVVRLTADARPAFPPAGFGVAASYPVQVAYYGAPHRAAHQAAIGAIKAGLEAAGADLATAGPRGGEFLLVYTLPAQVTP